MIPEPNSLLFRHFPDVTQKPHPVAFAHCWQSVRSLHWGGGHLLLSVILLRVALVVAEPLRSTQLCVRVPSAAITCSHMHFLYFGQVEQVFCAEHLISVQSATSLTNFFKMDTAPVFIIINLIRFGVSVGLPLDIGIHAKTLPFSTPCRPVTGSEYSCAHPQFGVAKHVLQVLFTAHLASS